MINITINGKKHELTPYNCAIFMFKDDKYNHLFIVTEEDNGMYVFGRPEILRKLIDTGELVMHYLPYVPEPDELAYHRWQASLQPPKLTQAEVDRLAKEFEGDINWDELD